MDKLKPLLYLDIDGVLNSHEPVGPALCGRIHHDKMLLLNDVLERTGAMVVLSSAWRYLVHNGSMTLDGLGWLLRSHGMIAGRLVDITRKDELAPRPPYSGNPADWVHTNERGGQIREWHSCALGIEGINIPYAVVDDIDLGISAHRHPFVQTDGNVGLTRADADRLIALLEVGNG